MAPLSRMPRRLPRQIRSDEADADQHALREEDWEDRGERRDAGRDADGDGQHVVDQQRGGGDQPGQRAEVVAGDDVGAAAAGVGRIVCW